jgi:hypothetical protein
MIEINKDVFKEFVSDFLSFTLYDYQLDFLKDCFESNRIVANFCRQTGKSLCISIFVALYCFLKSNINVVIVAPTDRQAGELFDKIKHHIMNNPFFADSILSMTLREAKFKNGSRIIALPVGDSGYSIRGFTADIVIEEESSRIKNSIHNEVIMPMGASRPDLKVIKISTPHGKNHFFDSYKDTVNWKVHKVDWQMALEAGQYNLDFIEQRKKEVDSLTWKVEYCAEFVESEDCFFSYDLVNSCIKEIKTEQVGDGKSSYILGADIARSGADSTVLITLKEGKENEVVNIV